LRELNKDLVFEEIILKVLLKKTTGKFSLEKWLFNLIKNFLSR